MTTPQPDAITRRDTVSIAPRFRGPPRSGNGGYVCGLIAAPLVGTVAVRLMAPPPLEKPLTLESNPTESRLLDGDAVIGSARLASLDLAVPRCPSLEEAQSASRSYLGFLKHPFPGCFVCGPDRAQGDGLRIFPGAVEGSSVVASPWTPDASLADESGRVGTVFLWSALDCTGGFAVLPAVASGAIVLGELCASIEGAVRAGEACIAIGWPLGSQGRKHGAGSAIYAADGLLIAKARATWVEVSADAFKPKPAAAAAG